MAPDTARPLTSEAAANQDGLMAIFNRQKAAYAAEPMATRAQRHDRLTRLEKMLKDNEVQFIDAINADFGGRARNESLSSEILVSISAINLARKNLRKWMKPRKVATPMHMAPSRSLIAPQPLGVIGIIAPWNYPLQLAISPAVAAIAAGNRVMIKPSELTPRTSALLQEISAATFTETELAIITGGVETGAAFAAMPFDHLLFTGSTTVGRIIAETAAKNLTPVTLELGGKSPAIIDPGAKLEKAASAIAFGKAFNAGQTCIAPDYVLVSPDQRDTIAQMIAAQMRKLFPEIDTTADYTSIISDRHFSRLKALIDEARAGGARIIEVGSAKALHPQGKLPLTLVIDPPEESGLMREEIFGPILPILTMAPGVDTISYINKRPRPLALYWFGEDKQARNRILSETVAGGVTINDVLLHCAQENLPFGGVGDSGIGAYHGAAGFDTFSHLKPIFHQGPIATSRILYPPYTDKTTKILNFLRKIL